MIIKKGQLMLLVHIKGRENRRKVARSRFFIGPERFSELTKAKLRQKFPRTSLQSIWGGMLVPMLGYDVAVLFTLEEEEYEEA